MENLLSFWNKLPLQRRIIVGAATVGVFVMVLMMARIANTPSMSLLYAGLDANSAGEVVASLEAQGAKHEVRGTSIFVESNRRDSLRMTLAAEGLPQTGANGYEILEQMTGFGTTSQMFDAAYWRAKEGELARTLAGSAGIKSARVHIANANNTPFQRKSTTTASVTLMTSGGAISQPQARAIQFLVASAVTGLMPEDVTVIDGQTGRIVSADADQVSGLDQESRAVALQKRVERLMSARVGPNSYVVEVSVETDRAAETLVQRTLDPNSRIVISTDSEETTRESSNSGAGGAVTVASNLPEGDAGGAGSSSNAQNASTRERINYDVSATEREIKRGPGAIKRISVAVIVDGTTTTDADGGTEWQPRSADELNALKQLVESAVGFDAERGDTISLQTLQFNQAYQQVPEAEFTSASGIMDQLDIQNLIQVTLLGLVALLLGLFVVRPAFKSDATATASAALPVSEGATTPPSGSARALPSMAPPVAPAPSLPDLPDLPALSGTIEEDNAPFAMPQMGTVSDFDMANLSGQGGDLPDLPAFNMASGDNNEDEDPVDRLRKLIEDRREETVEILRGWMEEKA